MTPRANILRGTGVAARNAAKTHCNAGHPLSEARIDPDGARVCRICDLAATHRYRARKRAERAAPAP